MNGIDSELSHYTVKDFIKQIIARTVQFIEDPYKAGLDEQCFDIYSSEIDDIVSSLGFQ
jgi:hypothetical protein